MPHIINSVDYSKLKKATIFFFVALIVLGVLFYLRKNIDNVPFSAIVILILGFPITWSVVLLFESQLSIFEDRIEKELWISVIAEWKKIKAYPKQELIIERMWSTSENPASCYLILKKNNGKKDYISFYAKSYSELKNESKNLEKMGILQVNDISNKDKRILTILSIPGLAILCLFGLFIVFTMGIWLVNLIS